LYALPVTVCPGKTPCFCLHRRLNRTHAGSCGTPLSCEVDAQPSPEEHPWYAPLV
jgi:hypothetical protein